MKKTFILLLIALNISAQTTNPKTEFRGVWITTVYNIDWPLSRTDSPSKQQSDLISILDSHKNSGINAVIFQVRPEGDALYASSYEPWSYRLTGTQGTAPSPYYDPLEFAVKEAHKRGMELHAWFNPYWVVRNLSSYTLASNHVVNTHPEWIITKVESGVTKKYLDPGIPAVRTYINNVIMDVVNNYDIDGIHFDDYFYPSSITNTDDETTYLTYNPGSLSRGDWRRDNVNQLIALVYSSIKAAKPHVKFGVSPFGIWKSGVPSGITGQSSYYDLYCDPVAWLNSGTVDYIMPQLYWQIGGSQDYEKLMNWWATQLNGRLLFTGNAAYRMESSSGNWSPSELINQIELNRANSNCFGCNFYTSNDLTSNLKNFADSLRLIKFSTKSLIPPLTWIDNNLPNPPNNLTASNDASGIKLSWNAPTSASDGDIATRYVIYRSTSSPVNISSASNILHITSNDTLDYIDTSIDVNQTYYYKITTLDDVWNESSATTEISFSKTSKTKIADFEVSMGVFDKDPNYSGSTVGVATASSSALYTADSHTGNNSLKVILSDDAASSSNWQVRLLSGTGSPSNNQTFQNSGYIGLWIKTSTAAPTAQVAITIDDSPSGTELSSKKNIINDGQWNLYEWELPGSGWTSFAGGNGVLGGSTLTLDAVMFYAPNNSSEWTILIDDVAHDYLVSLPVQIINFTAHFNKLNNKGNVILNWSTASEVNNYGFEIERASHTSTSLSVTEWEKVGFVQGHGNANAPNDYTFTDADVTSGNYQYRLKQIDFDGSVSYSDVVEVAVNISLEKLSMDVYPNPFNPSTTLAFVLPKESRVNLSIYDITGQKVAELIDNEVMEAGLHKHVFNASNLASGIYISVLQAEGMQVVKKLQLLK